MAEVFVAVHGFGEEHGVAVSASSSPVLRSQAAILVLGLVIEKPSHGYEIGRRFEDRFGALVRTGRASIYRTLGALERGGLIEAMSVEELGGVRRGARAGSSYRATPVGARAYRGWLAQRVRDDPERVEMLGRLTLAGVQSIEAALDFLDYYEQSCEQDARSLVASPPAEGEDDGRVRLVQELLLEERRRMIDAQFGWISYARRRLRAAQQGGGEL
ncbi:MAG TPA: PadR family transcriptional regulator [Solirubrobacteraceae bacterium]|nr:PadR family transcriptional regulator [Solirubrobacteraceae bacterium]